MEAMIKGLNNCYFGIKEYKCAFWGRLEKCNDQDDSGGGRLDEKEEELNVDQLPF